MIKYSTYCIFDKGGEFDRLRIRYRWDGGSFTFAPGIRIDRSKWVADSGRCKANTTHDGMSAAQINRLLSKYDDAAESLFAEYDLGQRPSSDEVRTKFLADIGRAAPSPDTLLSFIAPFIEEESRRNMWSEGVSHRFNSLAAVIKSFDAGLRPEEVDTRTMDRLIAHMADRGYNNSYIYLTVKSLKWVLRWMKRHGYYEGDAETYKPRLKMATGEGRAEVYLTWEELIQLYGFEYTKKQMHLEQARDVFVFCSFTSLRYSDVAKLRWSDVDLTNGVIHVVTKKTDDSLTIELNDYSRAVIEKYKDYGLPGGRVLPVISNQKYNNYIKEAAHLAGITAPVRKVYYVGAERMEQVGEKWQILTTHAARRTFVVSALYLGIPAEVVMRWTGHKDYKAMRPYVDIVDQLKRREMDKFNIKREP